MPLSPQIVNKMHHLIHKAICLAILTAPATGQLMGETITAQWHYPDFGTVLESHDVVVSAGVELPAGSIFNDSKFDIDIGDDWVEFRFNATSNWSNTNFNGWVFKDAAGTIGAFSNYYIESASAGITNMGSIVLGWSADEFWADFGNMQVAGGGEFIRLKVETAGFHLSVSNFIAGQTATIHANGATDGGQVGIAYSLAGPGPATVNTGICGLISVDLSYPIKLLGFYTASGGSVDVGVNIPAGGQGHTVWLQAMDVSTCELSNPLAETIL